jgi:hypothetical protein
MAKPTEKAVETWDLGKMLAVLCQVAQDAGAAESVPKVDQKLRFAPELPATDQEFVRLGRTNSLCKTARTKTEVTGGENLISSRRACPAEDNRRSCVGFHSKSSGGFAVSSRSDISVRQAASPTGCLGSRP